MKFTKYHALGNDYLVLDPADCQDVPTSNEIIKICHRNFGLGSDGILFGPQKSNRADFKLRIFNPDASEAEKSGNGIRIFSRYLFDTKRVEENKEFTIETLGGVVKSTILKNGNFIRVEMGKVSFDPKKIPVIKDCEEAINCDVNLNGKTYKFCAATIGNPHCVLPMAKVDSKIAHTLGPILENMTSIFPNRTNVQFLEVINRQNIKIEIWERGAGYTLASGSSSSAAAAVAYKLGLVDNKLTVNMPGGQIFIEIEKDFSVTMSGSVVKVGTYEMSNDVLLQELPVKSND